MEVKSNEPKKSYVYEIGLVKGKVITITADKFQTDSDGIKFSSNGVIILRVANQKWNYVHMILEVGNDRFRESTDPKFKEGK